MKKQLGANLSLHSQDKIKPNLEADIERKSFQNSLDQNVSVCPVCDYGQTH